MFDLKEEYYYKGEMDEPFMIKQKKKSIFRQQTRLD